MLGGSRVKSLPSSVGDTGDADSIPGSGRSLGGGNGNPLQYSCPENPMDREASWATVHGVSKSPTQLKRLCMHGYDLKNIWGQVLNDFLRE